MEKQNLDLISIREEISQLTFEQLQKLKNELGSKVYNEAIYGVKKEKQIKKDNFKRDNKNRPREMSSKYPVGVLRDVVTVTKKEIRDPRFESACGTFDEDIFKSSYAFLNEIRRKEKKMLKQKLKKEEDTETKKKLQFVVQRLENQEREEKIRKKKEEKKIEEHKKNIDMIKAGLKPRYQTKAERKLLNLVEQYEELKESGKLQKHIKKKRKKEAQVDKKKFFS